MATGIRIGSRHTAIEIDDVQAMLAFNRILQERKLASLLSRGCMAAAIEETDIRIDQDTKLLASLFKGRLSPRVSKYVDDRDPNLRETLDNFKSKYGDSWREPRCADSKGSKRPS
jgi:hypothetical protein